MRLISWNGPIIERASTNTQSIDSEGGILEEREHVFRAEFDEPVPDDFIYDQRQCPAFYSYMVFKNGVVSKNCFVVGRKIAQNSDGPQIYDITISYANKVPNNQNQDSPNIQFQWITNPLLRPAMIEWDSYIAREAVEFSLDENDKSNIPVWTSAGEPLVLEEQYYYRKMAIGKNVRQVTPIFAEGEYINEEDTTIGGHTFKKYTLWLLPVQVGHIHIENRILYYPITMNILHNPKTWIRRLRNAGYYMKSLNFKRDLPNVPSSTGHYPIEPILIDGAVKADRPILLKKDGRPFQLKVTGEAPHPTEPGFTIKEYIIQAPEDFGRSFTQAELEEATLYHRTKKLLNFTKNLPLK